MHKTCLNYLAVVLRKSIRLFKTKELSKKKTHSYLNYPKAFHVFYYSDHMLYMST